MTENIRIIGDVPTWRLGTLSAVRTIAVKLYGDAIGNYERALSVEGIPALFDIHPVNQSLLVTDITVEPLIPGVPDEAKIIITYGQLLSFNDEGEGSNAEKLKVIRPWERPPTWRFTSLKQEVATEHYYNAAGEKMPNVNSAGDLFFPPVMALSSVRLITVDLAYQCTQTPSWTDALAGTVNQNKVTILGRSGINCFYLNDAEYCLKYWYDPESQTDIPYFQVKLLIQYRPEGFKIDQIDMGYRQKSRESMMLEPVMDQYENISVRPIKLDGLGGALTWQEQADPTLYYMIGERLFYRPAVWNIPGLPEKECAE